MRKILTIEENSAANPDAEGGPLRLTKDLVRTWDQWIVWRLGGNPTVSALVVPPVMLASFFLPAWALGHFSRVVPEIEIEGVFGLDAFAWAAVVVSLMGGYAISVTSFAVMSDLRDLRKLLPVLEPRAISMFESWQENEPQHVRRGKVAGHAGTLLGIVSMLVTVPGAADLVGIRFLLPSAPARIPSAGIFVVVWFLVTGPALFYLFGKGLYFSIAEGRFMRRVQADCLKVDLFEINSLAPMMRVAMRRSFIWIVGATLGSLFFLSKGIDRTALEPLFIGICLVALSVLAPALFHIHRAIVSAKAAELADVRAAIRRERDAALGHDDRGTQANARLPGLIALERRIEQVREWPVDFGMVSRFALYLGIPLFSWVGGALVEKVVDVFL